MNVKYRESITRINDKETEIKSKNILELKEVNNMLRIEKINGKMYGKYLNYVYQNRKKSLLPQMMSVLLKHTLLSQQMDLHFHLVFMMAKLLLDL